MPGKGLHPFQMKAEEIFENRPDEGSEDHHEEEEKNEVFRQVLSEYFLRHEEDQQIRGQGMTEKGMEPHHTENENVPREHAGEEEIEKKETRDPDDRIVKLPEMGEPGAIAQGVNPDDGNKSQHGNRGKSHVHMPLRLSVHGITERKIPQIHMRPYREKQEKRYETSFERHERPPFVL